MNFCPIQLFKFVQFYSFSGQNNLSNCNKIIHYSRRSFILPNTNRIECHDIWIKRLCLVSNFWKRSIYFKTISNTCWTTKLLFFSVTCLWMQFVNEEIDRFYIFIRTSIIVKSKNKLIHFMNFASNITRIMYCMISIRWIFSSQNMKSLNKKVKNISSLFHYLILMLILKISNNGNTMKESKAHHGIKIRKWSNVNTGTQFHASFKKKFFLFPCCMNFRCFLFLLFIQKEVLLTTRKKAFFYVLQLNNKVM